MKALLVFFALSLSLQASAATPEKFAEIYMNRFEHMERSQNIYLRELNDREVGMREREALIARKFFRLALHNMFQPRTTESTPAVIWVRANTRSGLTTTFQRIGQSLNYPFPKPKTKNVETTPQMDENFIPTFDVLGRLKRFEEFLERVVDFDPARKITDAIESAAFKLFGPKTPRYLWKHYFNTSALEVEDIQNLYELSQDSEYLVLDDVAIASSVRKGDAQLLGQLLLDFISNSKPARTIVVLDQHDVFEHMAPSVQNRVMVLDVRPEALCESNLLK